MVVLNAISLVYLCRLVRHTTSNDRHFYRQLMCVAANDVLNGLALFLHPLVPVEEPKSAKICWGLIITQIAFVCATQVNILIISIQRYFIAVNARYDSRYTAIIGFEVLVVGNIVSFIVPLAFNLVTVPMEYEMNAGLCLPAAVFKEEDVPKIGFVGALALIPVTLLSVMISLGAIHHFSVSLRVIQPIAMDPVLAAQTTETKQSEKHIVVTLSLILLLYTIFIVPFSGVVVCLIIGVHISETFLGLSMCIGYLNSVTSPIVYMCRLTKYKLLLKQDTAAIARLFKKKKEDHVNHMSNM